MLNKSSYLSSITNMGCTLRMIKYKRGCAYSKYKYTFLFILLFSQFKNVLIYLKHASNSICQYSQIAYR